MLGIPVRWKMLVQVWWGNTSHPGTWEVEEEGQEAEVILSFKCLVRQGKMRAKPTTTENSQIESKPRFHHIPSVMKTFAFIIYRSPKPSALGCWGRLYCPYDPHPENGHILLNPLPCLQRTGETDWKTRPGRDADNLNPVQELLVEGEDRLLKVVLRPPHMYHHTRHTYVIIINKIIF